MILRIKDENGNKQEILAIRGEKGDDGVSPVVSVSKVGKETTIAITDAEGTKTTTILDGEDGEDGAGGGGTVELDTTLTQEGKAADAKAVGDRLTEQEKTIPKVFKWANAELPFTENEISGVVSGGGFGTNHTNFADGKTYFRYHAGSSYGFKWKNPNPQKGALEITMRGYSQYSNTLSTAIVIVYTDGTDNALSNQMRLTHGETVTYTTDPDKTVDYIRGNYDFENWVLLDMDVLSIVADYPEPTGAAGKDGIDGKDGVDGKAGADGKDGVSPVVSVSKDGKVTTITITDAEGTKTATILDGEDGEDGAGGGGTVELDTTLTVEGKAADAKAVGDAIELALNQGGGGGASVLKIYAKKGSVAYNQEIIEGGATKTYTAAEIHELVSQRSVTIETYTDRNTSVGRGLHQYFETDFATNGTVNVVRFRGVYVNALHKIVPAWVTINDLGNVFVSDVEWAAGSVETDQSLTKLGFPADAKKVGDRLTALSEQIASNSEAWTFTLEDGSTVTKTVVLK